VVPSGAMGLAGSARAGTRLPNASQTPAVEWAGVNELTSRLVLPNEQLLLTAHGGIGWLAAFACRIVVGAPQQNCGRYTDENSRKTDYRVLSILTLPRP
jgi:hypothetical protein